MTIEQARSISGIGPEESRVMLQSIIFDGSTVDMDTGELPDGHFWKVEYLSSIRDTSRLYRNGEETSFTIENYKWDDPTSPMFRGAVDGKHEFFGGIDTVLESVMAREKVVYAMEENHLARSLVGAAIS